MHGQEIITFVTVFAALSLTMLTQAATDQERLEILERRLDALTSSSQETEMMKQVQLGGYGELHYNNLSGTGGASDKKELDFHRFVLFAGYDFNERVRFNSELELEHALAGDGKTGEVELEQAYVDFDVTEDHTARAGLFLVPVGLINPTHEPPRFYGTERNPVEKNIIPTTWWEGGFGLHGQLGAGWQYEAALHSGLNTSTGSTYAVRSGRQKVAEANASDPAGTLAISWNIPGVSVGGALQYQSDITQGNDATAGSAWLGELHAVVQRGPFGLRALYAEWDLDGHGPESMGADRQIDTGVNWWPHEQVVFKADYQWQDSENGKEHNGGNLGVGYEF